MKKTITKKEMLLHVIKNKGKCESSSMITCRKCPIVDICNSSVKLYKNCVKEYIELYGEQELKEKMVEYFI